MLGAIRSVGAVRGNGNDGRIEGSCNEAGKGPIESTIIKQARRITSLQPIIGFESNHKPHLAFNAIHHLAADQRCVVHLKPVGIEQACTNAGDAALLLKWEDDIHHAIVIVGEERRAVLAFRMNAVARLLVAAVNTLHAERPVVVPRALVPVNTRPTTRIKARVFSPV
jgi:hypothetical protein